MNCKPGDIARIVHPEMYGKLVEVLFLIESREQGFEGFLLSKSSIGAWMCRALGAPIRQANFPDGIVREVMTAPIWDKWLRPIRDQDGEDEILRLVGKPETEQA